MNNLKKEFPLSIEISFKKLFELYRKQAEDANSSTSERLETLFDIERKYPILTTGISTQAQLKKFAPQIDYILADIFSPVLGLNEIKFATIPFIEYIFKSTKRYDDIIKAAGEGFEPELINFEHDHLYIMGCSLILNHYYGYNVDFKRPFYYNIPAADGFIHNYRVLYNADFIEFEKTPEAPEISQEDVNKLLESFEDVKVWKEKFPPKSYIFKGFAIANLFDVTLDVSISDFKANLLRRELYGGTLNVEFGRIFRTIFNLPELKIGFTDYNLETESFERQLYKDIESFILCGKKSEVSKDALCSTSFYTLFKQKDIYCVTDAERYHNLYPDNLLYKKMIDQNLKSALFASIVEDNQVLGVLELVSPNANDLNTINANKLKDIMPFLVDSVVRTKNRVENELELIVQEECTSIHNSVHWKFRKEAQRYMNTLAEGNPTFFREIVFEDVYPLYGQIDIKGSSEARNLATKQDLELQLEHIQKIINKINILEPLPIYEEMDFSITGFLSNIEMNLHVDTEKHILTFLKADVIPLFQYLQKNGGPIKELIDEYYGLIDINTGFVYNHRKDYDESVMLINKKLASILDKKQSEAQTMFPHYFERFKTDGVEHNMYIGASITKEKPFNKIYLRNLKLWQLQVMCEMENSFYKMKEQLPIALDVASMILAFNGTLSLRFRMDEKRFDVDGTYNARYEVVKKRVDKANIKNTKERITQAGKIAIIYSQKEDEEEYLKYISFLQNKSVLDTEVELLELEDLQGVTGLKAIRVSILYSHIDKKDSSKEFYTYEDLMCHINEK